MKASSLNRLVAELHGVVSELRLVAVEDPRWGVHWDDVHRLCQAIDAQVPAPYRRITDPVLSPAKSHNVTT